MKCPFCEGSGTCLQSVAFKCMIVEMCPYCLGTGTLDDDFFAIDIEKGKHFTDDDDEEFTIH